MNSIAQIKDEVSEKKSNTQDHLINYQGNYFDTQSEKS